MIQYPWLAKILRGVYSQTRNTIRSNGVADILRSKCFLVLVDYGGTNNIFNCYVVYWCTSKIIK